MEFEIDAILTTPDNKTEDEIAQEFIEWAESQGYTFGGSITIYSPEDDD